MKSLVIALIVLFLFFGCISVVEKEPKTNGEDLTKDGNIQTQDPFEDLLEKIEDEIIEDTPPEEETPPEEVVPPEPPPEEKPPPVEPPPLPPPIEPPKSTASVALLVDTNSLELAEEQFVERTGIGAYSGNTFKIYFERAISTGSEFIAKFRIENSAGEVLSRQSFSAGEELVFVNNEDKPVTFDGLLELVAVYLD